MTPRTLNRPAIWGAVGLLATFILLGFPSLQYGKPLSLSGDHLFMLKTIREMVDGVFRVNERVGAPWGNDNFYFPLFDFSNKAIAWLASRFTSNIFKIAYINYAVGIALIYVFSFWAFVRLGVQHWLAAFGGVVFVASPFLALRSFNHDYLSLYYAVPLGAALPLVVAVSPWRKAKLFILATILVVGTSGVYYAAFTCIFGVLGASMVSARQRSWSPIIVVLGSSVAISVLLLVSTYGPWLPDLFSRTVPAPVGRGGAIVQLYHGMILSDAMRDYANIGMWTSKFAEYLKVSAQPPFSGLIGEGYAPEWPGALITTIILASVVAGPILAVWKPKEDNSSYLVIVLSALLCAFGVAFSVRGGLGYVFNYMIIDGIRAQERALPFLTFYALAMLLVAYSCVLSWNRTAGIVAGPIIAVCLLPGVSIAYRILPTKQAAALAQSDGNVQSLKTMLAAKDAAGLHMILQVPVVFWPESPLVEKFDPYQSFMPYLLSAPGDMTRWSYGLSWYQKGYHDILDATSSMEPGLAARASSFGYDGILIEKAALTPSNLERFTADLHQAGACVLFDDGSRLLMSVKPCS
jgi:phosphoglycerol transferase